MADSWRFKFYAMQNGQPGFTSESYLFDLPLNQVTFSSILGQVGSFSATVQMTDSAVKNVLLGQPPLHLLEDKTAIYVDLNGALVWGGILQQVGYDEDGQKAQLNGVDWWGYFALSRIISWNSSYSSIDQLLIASDLINIAQGNASTPSATPNIQANTVVGGNVGVQMGASATAALNGTYTSNVLISPAWRVASFKSIGQAVSDLGTTATGFDWTIDVAYDANKNPTKFFNIWYPRAGRTQQTQQIAGSAVVFDRGSTSGIKYSWPSGQSPPANTVYGAGAGAGAVSISSQQSDPSMLGQGWPLLEDSASFTDVSSQLLLDVLTRARMYSRRLPVSLPMMRYAAGNDSNQPLGSFALGDDCRLLIPPDPYFPTGYDSSRGNTGENWWRVIQAAVTVNDEGKSWMDLSFVLPPVLPGF